MNFVDGFRHADEKKSVYLSVQVMYTSLGDHWASSIPAFLSLCCVPFPILFYRHGSRIRAKCQYAAEAAQHLENLQEKV